MRPSTEVIISPSGVGVLEAEPSIEGVERRETLLPRDDMQSEGGVLAPFENEGGGERAGEDGENGEREGAGEAKRDGEISGTDEDEKDEKDERGRPERYSAENGETDRERDIAGEVEGEKEVLAGRFFCFAEGGRSLKVRKTKNRKIGW